MQKWLELEPEVPLILYVMDHDRCQQALLQIGINMMALPGGRHLDSITLPGQRQGLPHLNPD
ncbi:hypothetical protein P7K49_022048 [Saguinus oedipus]|uniref:Uncharacterized protein n=1 Tax=Saguinus oedipus TaxID=9490 RepID=A0ABQ9UUF3_SAGOE|nr:hypothetical protein P7K49_022048 [Saguinus oedipus]